MSPFPRSLRAIVDDRAPCAVRRVAAMDRERAESAVMVVIAGAPPDARVLLVRRAESLSRHAGEIGFPGGVHEPDDPSLLSTALRETREEVDLHLAERDVIGPLDQVYAGERYVVSPYLAWVEKWPPLRADLEEIAEILTPELSQLVDTARFRNERYEVRGHHIDGYAYHLDEGRVWGATARILHGLLQRAERVGTLLG